MKTSFIAKVINRIEALVLKILSASMLTWTVLFIAMCKGWISFSGESFLLFTAAVIGIKRYTDLKKTSSIGG